MGGAHVITDQMCQQSLVRKADDDDDRSVRILDICWVRLAVTVIMRGVHLMISLSHRESTAHEVQGIE
jgi:hypothetical protein